MADLRGAIEEEIEAVAADLARRRLDRPIPALSGRLRGEVGTGYRYAFQIAGGTYDIRADDRVRIHTGGRDALGVVHRFDRTLGLLQVVSPEWLGERLDGAELEFDPTWLLQELSTRLAEVGQDPEDYFPDTVLGVFGRLPPRLGRESPRLDSSGDLNAPQRDALERVLGSSAQLVWGPPGTGKSRLVARAALELALRGRVLVAATTNGAVDEIARRLASIADPAMLARDRIIRVGFDLGASPDSRIDLGAALARRIEGGAGGVDRTLVEQEGRLGARPAAGARDGAPALNPYARAGRLLALARSRSDAESARDLGRVMLEIARQAERVLEEADIVLTTFARLSIREELRELRFESLLIDEASTAPLPYVAFAASRVAGPAIAVGDFQQLPPVVSSAAPAAMRWLRTDLFREAGVVGGAGAGDPAEAAGGPGAVSALPSPKDGLCAMLDLQYRMAPDIRELVSEFFYGGRLRDAPEIAERAAERAAGSAAERAALTVLDTSGLDPRVERVDGSRRNRAHAEAVADFLGAAARDGVRDIAVVSPYRAQTRHLNDLIRRRLGRAAPADLEVSTIHRFQGREKRLVLIDTVDAPPGRSWFLDERRNRDFPRLLNVALSRARERLVIVATVAGLRRTLPPEALLNRLLAQVQRTGSRIDATPTDLWSGG
ncbi:MAG: AAA domain-containing protein [Gemmatimonadota bacterium]|uniref:AAA domain-containing protein n=1 Tax=Candidatus Palauibacter scopulicola TaxID=3056741 RepID=UPI0023A223EF|nr:AAA domain-containing protein [Candidatus Palauibacter scopulicola]MDE2661627.1 AAA domain-containing protein [Candidatus Palauibacter scopulicola]